MAKLRVVAAFVTLIAFSRLLAGCGGGGDDSANSREGSIEGFAFIQGGAVVLRNSSAPPAGATPLTLATVSVTGHAGNVTTDSTGRFLLKDVPVGQRTLRITPAGGAGAPPVRDVLVTVLGRATIQVGAFTVSRQQAVDAAKASLTGTASDYRIMAPQQPLPVGVALAPALGNDSGLPDPTLTYSVTTPQWLIYADAFGEERFQHPVSYVLVDAESGVVTQRAATSWPRINGVSHYPDYDINADAQDLVQTGRSSRFKSTVSERVRQDLSITRGGRDHVQGATDPKTYALLIQGNSRGDMERDLANMKANLLGPNGLSGAFEIKEWSPPLEGTVDAPRQIRALFDEICDKAREQDTILVYITSHGARSGATYVQQGVEADESVTEDGLLFPHIDLKATRCRACHVIYIIDTCYAGEQMVKLAVDARPHAGQKMTVLASSLSSETSGGISRVRAIETGKPLGGYFTNGFLAALSAFRQTNGSAGQANLPAIFDDAITRMLTDRQNPQRTFIWDGQTCGAPPANLVSVTPESVTATHTVGVTSCPQSLGSLSLKNLTDFTIGYTTTLNHDAFNLTLGSGSIPPKGTRSLGLSFNCGMIPPIVTGLDILATYAGSTQDLYVPITLNRGQ